jgi:hypothetical protein
MQANMLCSCRGRGGDRHGSEFAVEGLVKEGLLQFLQGGKIAFFEASEVLGIYAQVVGGLLAVISAGIAQQAGVVVRDRRAQKVGRRARRRELLLLLLVLLLVLLIRQSFAAAAAAVAAALTATVAGTAAVRGEGRQSA